MRVLLTGASGTVGRYLARRLAPGHELIGTHFSALPPGGIRSERLDLQDPEAPGRLLSRLRPGLVVHAAAMADPDVCEGEPELAREVNAEGARRAALGAVSVGARLVYLSSDLVFDGKKGSPYLETDEPHPRSVYAQTKLDGERHVLEACPRALVLRLSLGYGWRSRTGRAPFSDSLCRSLREGRKARLFSDQFRTTLYLEDAAELIARAAFTAGAAGVFHAAGPERVSRLRFGELMCGAFGLDQGLIEPVRMADVPEMADRPPDCSLDGSRLWELTGFRPRGVLEGLRAMRAEGAT